MRAIQTLGLIALSGMFIGSAGCKSGPGDAEVCDNGSDDDGDGATDCDDNECATDAACGSDTQPDVEDCNNGADDDGDGAEDCDDSDCAGNSDCAPALLVPYYVGADGFFAYDADADQVMGATAAGTALPPSVTVIIASQEYFDSNFDPAYECTINLVYTGTDPIDLQTFDFTFDGTDYTHSGFIMPDGDFSVDSDCTADENKALDESVMGSVDDIANSGWGVTVGNFDPDVEDLIVQSDPYGDGTTGNFVGGGFFWDVIAGQTSLGLPDGVSPFDYGNGIAIDSSGNLLNVDGDVATSDDLTNGNLLILDATDVVNPSGVPPTGFYSISNASGWTFSQ